MKLLKLLALALFLGATTFACGDTISINTEDNHDDHSDHDEHEDHADSDEHGGPADEACVHFDQGPFKDIATVTDPTATKPIVAADHTAYKFDATSDTQFVDLKIEEAGDFVLMWTQDVNVDAARNGTPVNVEDAVLEHDCTTLLDFQVYPLTVGTFELAVSSDTSADDYMLVVEHFEDDHADE